ncbi:hypothetical protein [Ralstonia phage RP13]|nr:hypothetical protein [Ralstonia phage RP13]
MITSTFQDKLQGIVRVDKVAEDGTVLDTIKQNLVVDLARTTIRDLLYQPNSNSKLNVLQLGTMGMNYGDNTTNLPSPSNSDIALVSPYYTVTASTRTPLVMYNRPALQLFFSIPSGYANDPNPAVMNKLITELGLFTDANALFARVIIPLVKTRDIGLNIYWTVII